MTLRSKLIRLAHANPELRAHLLPLLKASTQEKEGPVAGSDGNYMTKQNLWLTHQMAESLYNEIPDGMLLPDWAESKINSAADHIKAVAGWAQHEKSNKTASEEGSGSKDFAEILGKKFKGVKEKNGSGNVDLGPINIYWDESNNDDAVTVGITFKKQIKGSPKEMFDAVTAILKAIS